MNLFNFLNRQQRWSRETFGGSARSEGVCRHIESELAEVRANPTDLFEWIDIAILALDGAWRAGHTPYAICKALEAKQAINMAREWPVTPDDQPSMHVKPADHWTQDAPTEPDEQRKLAEIGAKVMGYPIYAPWGLQWTEEVDKTKPYIFEEARRRHDGTRRLFLGDPATLREDVWAPAKDLAQAWKVADKFGIADVSTYFLRREERTTKARALGLEPFAGEATAFAEGTGPEAAALALMRALALAVGEGE